MLENGKFVVRYKTETGASVGGAETQHYTISVKECSSGRLVAELLPKTKMTIDYIAYEIKHNFLDNDKVYPNGYQAWTVTAEYTRDDVVRGILPPCNVGIFKKYAAPTSDFYFRKYSNKPGELQGYTYSYIRNGKAVNLLGSLSEKSGFTIFNFFMKDDIITIEKEVEGVEFSDPYPLFDIVAFSGDMDSTFDSYFALMDIPPRKVEYLSGYTSWYNQFGNITEATLIRDLNGLSRVGDKANIFQIDDGYQIKVGDWLTLKDDKFPNGMRYLSDKIHEKNMLAGIWIAPFSAAADSTLVKQHPEWLVLNHRGKPEKGVTMAWKCGAYILDFYKEEVADYIRNFFRVILNDWNFDMVKLDFLYSICMIPRYNKSRGQIMCEAMEFLRDCVGDKLILGCGVPLGPSFGKVDACRISCDAELTYKDKFYVKLTNREIPSTLHSMNNSIMRRHLNGRAFLNDPDVFHLRRDNLTFTEEQKKLLATINNMFGQVLFTSDNVGDYDEEQLDAVKGYFTPTKRKVILAEYTDRLNSQLRIEYIEDGEQHELLANLKEGTFTVK